VFRRVCLSGAVVCSTPDWFKDLVGCAKDRCYRRLAPSIRVIAEASMFVLAGDPDFLLRAEYSS
jgi:hypothetical protein